MIIANGKIEAHINANSGGFLVIVTYNGDCLLSVPSRLYTSIDKAKAGAKRMMAKVHAIKTGA